MLMIVMSGRVVDMFSHTQVVIVNRHESTRSPTTNTTTTLLVTGIQTAAANIARYFVKHHRQLACPARDTTLKHDLFTYTQYMYTHINTPCIYSYNNNNNNVDDNNNSSNSKSDSNNNHIALGFSGSYSYTLITLTSDENTPPPLGSPLLAFSFSLNSLFHSNLTSTFRSRPFYHGIYFTFQLYKVTLLTSLQLRFL